MKTTLIQVKRDTAKELKKLKEYNRQSYDEIIRKLIETNDGDILTDEDINDIKAGLDDIKAGGTTPIEKVAKDLHISLKG